MDIMPVNALIQASFTVASAFLSTTPNTSLYNGASRGVTAANMEMPSAARDRTNGCGIVNALANELPSGAKNI